MGEPLPVSLLSWNRGGLLNAWRHKAGRGQEDRDKGPVGVGKDCRAEHILLINPLETKLFGCSFIV